MHYAISRIAAHPCKKRKDGAPTFRYRKRRAGRGEGWATRLAGSTEIGNKVILTGQVGVVGHCKVGDGAIVTPQSGVAGDIEAGAIVNGAPAVDHRLWLKYSALLSRLPEIVKGMRKK